MKVFFSTISEVLESFTSKQTTDIKMEELLNFVENKLQKINESSLGFFTAKNQYEKLDEKIMNIFLEENREISSEELKILTTHISTQQQNKQTKKKFYYIFGISLVLLGVSTYFILNETAELRSFGFSTFGLVIGYWLK